MFSQESLTKLSQETLTKKLLYRLIRHCTSWEVMKTDFSSLENKFLIDTKKRLVEALLPIIILINIHKRSIMSPPNTMLLIKNHYNIVISPGTIYPIFHKLEKEGHIKKINKRNYILTSKGQKTLEPIQGNISIQSVVSELIK
jgi:hypothetical protein